MIKRLSVSLAVVCLVGAADAADLSMTPIYKSRPSAVSSLDGRLKDEYRAFNLTSAGQLNQLFTGAIADAPTKARSPMNDRTVQTRMEARF